MAAMRELPHTRSCFVCGEANPLGLNLRFETDGQRVWAQFTPRGEHMGFKDVIHGGLLATVLDEIMVWACAVRTGRFAYSVEMTVRYHRPARPGERLLLSGELTANRRGRLFEARAGVCNGRNELLAQAMGKYMPIPTTALPPMLEELSGPWPLPGADGPVT